MNEAIVTGAFAVLVCVISNLFQNIRTRNIIEIKIDNLEKTVQKHNSIIERTYELEKHEQVHDEQIKVINHRIEDLERKN